MTTFLAPPIRRAVTDGFRSQALVHWRGRSASLECVSGQTLTFSRASTRTGTDSAATSYTAVHSMPAWTVKTLYDSSTALGLAVGAADALTTAAPTLQGWTGVLDLMQSGAAVSTDYFFSVSNAAVTGAYFYVRGDATQYSVRWNDGTTSRTCTLTRAAAEDGKRVRLRFVLSASGTVQLWLTVDGAAEIAGTVTAATALTGIAFPTDALCRFNQHGSASNGVAGWLQNVKLCAGTLTLAQMDALI